MTTNDACAKILTQLDPTSTHGDSRRTASDRPRLLVFTEGERVHIFAFIYHVYLWK